MVTYKDAQACSAVSITLDSGSTIIVTGILSGASSSKQFGIAKFNAFTLTELWGKQLSFV